MLTVLECDLGIIAGSLPMLRRYFRRWDPNSSSKYGKSSRSNGRSTDINLATIGGGSRSHMKLGTGTGTRDKYFDLNDKDSHDDSSSSRHIIHITREIQQDTVSARGVPEQPFHVTSVQRGRK